MAPKVRSNALRSERSDANKKIDKNTYELTITYLPTYKDMEKKVKHSTYEIEQELQHAVHRLRAYGVYILESVYELGSNERPHIHAIAVSKVRIYPYPKFSGFRLHFTQKWKKLGLSNWRSYMKKEVSVSHIQKSVERWFKEPNNFVFKLL